MSLCTLIQKNMKKLASLSLLFGCLLLLPTPAWGKQNDPIARVQAIYKKDYLDEDTYRFPERLSNKNPAFRKLSHAQKEESLRSYFRKERKSTLISIAGKDFRQAAFFVVGGVSLFFVVAAYTGLLRMMWLGLQLPFKDTSVELQQERKKFFQG